MKKLVISLLTLSIMLTGCNTIKGFGKDVSKAGEGISNTAQKVEKKI
ncbi:MAG: entericidin A/B family lipoprotein [Moraxella sp.]|nr:entericidin A/B family lipoprotein [Moraxella sp.]